MVKSVHELKSYEDDYHLILKVIVRRIPVAYAKWSNVNGIDATDYSLILDSIMKGIQKHLVDEKEYVFVKTKTKINDYLNSFEVAPNDSIDEFKIIYFTAMTLAESLKNKSLLRESKVILTSMIWLLDYRLSTKNAVRKNLTRRIIKMIERDKVLIEAGEVGLYLIYKCLYNQANSWEN